MTHDRSSICKDCTKEKKPGEKLHNILKFIYGHDQMAIYHAIHVLHFNAHNQRPEQTSPCASGRAPYGILINIGEETPIFNVIIDFFFTLFLIFDNWPTFVAYIHGKNWNDVLFGYNSIW